MAEHDPITVSLEQVAQAAGTSRPLVHTYFGDRRGLLDAVQVRIVRRLADWVEHGLARARSTDDVVHALTAGVFAFVDQERDTWRLLTTSGGLDHPDLHAVRARWASALGGDEPDRAIGATAVVAALLLGAGSWVARGEEPTAVAAVLTGALRPVPHR